MVYSQITLYEHNGLWQVKIRHSGHVVKGGRYTNAADAYINAEAKLTCKPGYIQAISRSER